MLGGRVQSRLFIPAGWGCGQRVILSACHAMPKKSQDQNIFQREREQLVEEEAKELKAEILRHFGFKSTVILLMVQKSG